MTNGFFKAKRENLVQLVIQTTDVRNARLVNVLDEDLKIVSLLNVRSHPKIMRNDEIKYVLVKLVIVYRKKNATTAGKKQPIDICIYGTYI